MAELERDRGQRRVYVLPTELVERIVEFQNEMGLASEVEAARRLLDEALKHRDDAMAIARRFRERLSETKMFADIAKDVLVGHPRITSINFFPNYIQFTTSDETLVTLKADGSGTVGEGYGRSFNTFAAEKKGHGTLDDEIPF